MRLYDELMLDPYDSEEWRKYRDGELAGATVLDVSNVASWFLEQLTANLNESSKFLKETLTRCVPPFHRTFVEFSQGVERFGVLVYAKQFEDRRDWAILARVWRKPEPTMLYQSLGEGCVFVSDDGELNWDSYDVLYDDNFGDDDEPADKTELMPDEHRALTEEMITFAFPIVLAAFRFVHCSNTVLNEHSPNRGDRRRAERENLPAPTRWYTLDVEPVKRLLKTEGQIDTVGLAKALHLCRGHFADYTKGKGLFGKYKVEVFVPEHVRGSASRGVVVKDYRIGEKAVGSLTRD